MVDFSLSRQSADLVERVETFVAEHIAPLEAEYLRDLSAAEDPFQTDPRVESLKQKAREAGLWNLFLPDPDMGAGLSVSEYAPIAELTGRYVFAPEVFNCNAPDTGNMEVLYHFGTDSHKEKWLTPLLAGQIRSAFCMTEPDVASSDATNMEASIVVDGDELVLNGTKWWSTGIGHPNCKLIIFMGLSNPDAPRHQQHSMVLVPVDTPGVKIRRMLPVFGEYDPPYGHGEVEFSNVRVPRDHVIAGLGEGFAIAQGRLGPGRIHHCMRLIGASERALELMIQRGLQRQAFGKPILYLDGNRERIANARMAIDQARLLVQKAAWLIDTKGVKSAMSEISQIKVVCPNIAQQIIDDAIQMFGAAGLSEETPLAQLFIGARSLRIADGPDAVHRSLIARMEIKKYKGAS